MTLLLLWHPRSRRNRYGAGDTGYILFSHEGTTSSIRIRGGRVGRGHHTIDGRSRGTIARPLTGTLTEE